MNNRIIHVGLAPDKTIVSFKGSYHAYLRVSDKNGVGGVVRLLDGLFVYIKDIYETLGLNVMEAYIVAWNLNEYYNDGKD